MNHTEVINSISKIIYSESMKALHYAPSPIKGFSDAGSAMKILKAYTGYVALNNKLDCDYCELLALLYFFDNSEFGDMLQDETIRSDIDSIKRKDVENASREACCVLRVLHTLEQTRTLPVEELNQNGGLTIYECAKMDGIHV